jgi:hypothetical protein
LLLPAGAAHDASSDDDQDVPLHSKRDRGRAVTPSGRAPAAKRGKRNGQTPAAMKGLRGKGAAGDQGSPTRPRGRQARVADDSESDGMDEDGSSDDGVAASDQRRPTASRTSSQAARKPQPAKKVRGGSRLDSKRASRRGGRAGLGSGKVAACKCAGHILVELIRQVAFPIVLQLQTALQ